MTLESLSLWCSILNCSKILERSEPPELFLLWLTGWSNTVIMKTRELHQKWRTFPYQWDIANVTGGTWHRWAIRQREPIMAHSGLRISRNDDGEIDPSEFVSYSTYYAKWRRWVGPLKTSATSVTTLRIATSSLRSYDKTGRSILWQRLWPGWGGSWWWPDLVLGDHNDPEVADEIATLTTSVNNLSRPDCAIDKVAEQREQMMLDAAEHIKMARAQRQLYQDKVTERYGQWTRYIPNGHTLLLLTMAKTWSCQYSTHSRLGLPTTSVLWRWTTSAWSTMLTSC